MSYDRSSRTRLSPRALPHFQEGPLFHHIARAVCPTDCLPRKELYESWEVARRARRRFRGGRVVDLACGHALIAHLMLLLGEPSERAPPAHLMLLPDDPAETALAVDRRLPASAAPLAAAMTREWPRLAGRIEVVS